MLSALILLRSSLPERVPEVNSKGNVNWIQVSQEFQRRRHPGGGIVCYYRYFNVQPCSLALEIEPRSPCDAERRCIRKRGLPEGRRSSKWYRHGAGNVMVGDGVRQEIQSFCHDKWVSGTWEDIHWLGIKEETQAWKSYRHGTRWRTDCVLEIKLWII